MNFLKSITTTFSAMIFAIFALASSASADIISWDPYIDVEYKYYNVTGNNPAGIRASIVKNSNVKVGTQRRASRTRITSKMQYSYKKTSFKCYMKKGRAYNKAIQTLPKLTSSVSAALRTKFDVYVKALKKYERAGLEFRVKAAQEVQKYYRTDPIFSCDTFAKQLSVQTNSIYKKWDKKMYKYWHSTKPPTFK